MTTHHAAASDAAYRAAIWPLLIAHGGAVAAGRREEVAAEVQTWGEGLERLLWSSSGRPQYDLGLTLEVLQELADDGVDWAACDDPAQVAGAEFDGTDNDALEVPNLIGTLVTGTGRTITWALTLPHEQRLTDLVHRIATHGLGLGDAIDTCLARATHPHARHGFGYLCVLPAQPTEPDPVDPLRAAVTARLQR